MFDDAGNGGTAQWNSTIWDTLEGGRGSELKASTNACYEWAGLPCSDDRSGTIDDRTRPATQYVR